MRAPVSDLPIVVEAVTARAGAATMLDRVSLAVRPGGPTVLIGPNGCGKTTLIRIGMGLLSPTSGCVTWGGRVDGGARCAVVLQHPVMLRRSTAANVKYALRRPTADRVADLLRQVGLAELADRPARRLSGGERQRLALARALARDPEVLFLDEPTASLDPASTKAVEEIVQSVAASGVKIVMATHDLGQARRLAGDIVFLVRGRVAEVGPAAEFLTSPSTNEAAAFLRGDIVI